MQQSNSERLYNAIQSVSYPNRYQLGRKSFEYLFDMNGVKSVYEALTHEVSADWLIGRADLADFEQKLSKNTVIWDKDKLHNLRVVRHDSANKLDEHLASEETESLVEKDLEFYTQELVRFKRYSELGAKRREALMRKISEVKQKSDNVALKSRMEKKSSYMFHMLKTSSVKFDKIFLKIQCVQNKFENKKELLTGEANRTKDILARLVASEDTYFTVLKSDVNKKLTVIGGFLETGGCVFEFADLKNEIISIDGGYSDNDYWEIENYLKLMVHKCPQHIEQWFNAKSMYVDTQVYLHELKQFGNAAFFRQLLELASHERFFADEMRNLEQKTEILMKNCESFVKLRKHKPRDLAKSKTSPVILLSVDLKLIKYLMLDTQMKRVASQIGQQIGRLECVRAQQVMKYHEIEMLSPMFACFRDTVCNRNAQNSSFSFYNSAVTSFSLSNTLSKSHMKSKTPSETQARLLNQCLIQRLSKYEFEIGSSISVKISDNVHILAMLSKEVSKREMESLQKKRVLFRNLLHALRKAIEYLYESPNDFSKLNLRFRSLVKPVQEMQSELRSLEFACVKFMQPYNYKKTLLSQNELERARRDLFVHFYTDPAILDSIINLVNMKFY